MVVPSFLPLRSLRFSKTRNGETGADAKPGGPNSTFPFPRPRPRDNEHQTMEPQRTPNRKLPRPAQTGHIIVSASPRV